MFLGAQEIISGTFKNIEKKNIKENITWIMFTNNEMKDLIKVIRSLENKGILLKGDTSKINSQKGGLIIFLAPLTRFALSLMH